MVRFQYLAPGGFLSAWFYFLSHHTLGETKSIKEPNAGYMFAH